MKALCDGVCMIGRKGYLVDHLIHQPLMLLLAVFVYYPLIGIVSLFLAADFWQSGFCHAGPTVWNSLQDELRNSDSFDGLKRFLETILFSRY